MQPGILKNVPFACTHLKHIHNTYTCTCTMQYVRDECAGSTSQRVSPLPTAQLYWAVSEDIVITDSHCGTYTQPIHTLTLPHAHSNPVLYIYFYPDPSSHFPSFPPPSLTCHTRLFPLSFLLSLPSSLPPFLSPALLPLSLPPSLLPLSLPPSLPPSSLPLSLSQYLLHLP